MVGAGKGAVSQLRRSTCATCRTTPFQLLIFPQATKLSDPWMNPAPFSKFTNRRSTCMRARPISSAKWTCNSAYHLLRKRMSITIPNRLPKLRSKCMNRQRKDVSTTPIWYMATLLSTSSRTCSARSSLARATVLVMAKLIFRRRFWRRRLPG